MKAETDKTRRAKQKAKGCGKKRKDNMKTMYMQENGKIKLRKNVK